jgi:hypothetical protein
MMSMKHVHGAEAMSIPMMSMAHLRRMINGRHTPVEGLNPTVVSPGTIWIIEAAVGHSALKGIGCKRIYEEKVSGAKRARPELARMLDQLRAGDMVVVSRLDRLARSTRDLLEIAEQLKEAEAGLRSLHEPWADTTSPAGRAGRMVLTVFADITEFERELIHKRTRSGRVAAIRRSASVAHRS